MGDISPIIPDFIGMWNDVKFSPQIEVARLLPFPVIMLDQLQHFATAALAPEEASNYTTFQWYGNIFSQGHGDHDQRLRLGPQLCGSLFTNQHQHDAARTFWGHVLQGQHRINANDGHIAFDNYLQLLGFRSQDGNHQLDWFQPVMHVMQKYCLHFNDSIPLRQITPISIGSVSMFGIPTNSVSVRNWFYPPDDAIAPFPSSRFAPRREIPSDLTVTFQHADHELESLAEQYAILTHTNMRWTPTLEAQHDLQAVNDDDVRHGHIWTMTTHHRSVPVQFKNRYSLIIASHYHVQKSNRT
ncbi:hypothetical protein MKW92_038052 [Papaver armeniacum]|nr:hypothetical protein MKW92_038052 [Papaver armeniacum]